MPSPRTPVVLRVLPMLGAAALWGASGGVVSGLGVSGASAASAVELATGILLLGITAAGGRWPREVFAALGLRRVAILGLVEAVNVLFYYVALQLGPVGPVMAIHLMAPVLLAVLAIARGTVKQLRRAILSAVMAAAALLLFAFGGNDSQYYPHLAVALGLSLLSAACLALFVTLVSSAANEAPPMAAAGAQMFVSGLLLSPALLQLGSSGSALLPLLLISLVLFAPACWLYWVAMKRLSVITASTVLLAEPFFGTLVAVLLYGQRPSLLQGAAALLIVGATYLSLATRDADDAPRQGAKPAIISAPGIARERSIRGEPEGSSDGVV